MGRALFSHRYSPSTAAPAIRQEPEPPVDLCEKWSVWNQFDPDSDEFFKDAQLEHFVDGPIDNPTEDPELGPPHVVVLDSITDSSSSTSTIDNDDSLSDSDSPMAVGADDPATLLAGAYTPIDWQQRFLEAGSDARRQTRPSRIPYRAPRRIGTTRQLANAGDTNSTYIFRTASMPVFIPPASYRNTSTSTPSVAPPTATAAQTHESASTSSPAASRSPISRRTVSITPINIPSERSLPSPATPDTRSTLSPQSSNLAANSLSPSPAPNVTSRVYTWSRTSHLPRDSPLTNPRARMSLSRIDTMALAQHQYIPVLDH